MSPCHPDRVRRNYEDDWQPVDDGGDHPMCADLNTFKREALAAALNARAVTFGSCDCPSGEGVPCPLSVDECCTRGAANGRLTVRQWFRTMRAVDFARAIDQRTYSVHNLLLARPRPWTIFDTQAVVDRETKGHYSGYAAEDVYDAVLGPGVPALRCEDTLDGVLPNPMEQRPRGARMVMTPDERKGVLEFLEFIIVETGMSTDPETLAAQIFKEAIALRERLEANTGARSLSLGDFPIRLDPTIPDGTIAMSAPTRRAYLAAWERQR